MIDSRLQRRCAFLLAGVGVASGSALASDTPYRSESFDTAGLHALDVRTSGGSIEVVGGTSDKATVDVFVTTNHGSSDAKDIEKRIGGYRIAIVRDGDVLRAESENHSEGWRSQLNVSFKIRLPRDVNSTIKTSGGDLRLTDVSGTERLDTSGGSIHLENIKGTTEASTSGGDIEVTGYNGRLTAHTSGGSVTAQQGDGEFDLQTSGGSIRIDQLSGVIAGSSSGGSVRADVTRLTGALSLSTGGGDVRASVPLDHGLDLALDGDNVDVKLVNFSGTATREHVSGKINGGGLPVRLSTSGGSVHLSFKQ